MPKNKHGVKPDRDNRTASSGVEDKRRHVIARIDAAVCKQTRPCFSKGDVKFTNNNSVFSVSPVPPCEALPPVATSLRSSITVFICTP